MKIKDLTARDNMDVIKCLNCNHVDTVFAWKSGANACLSCHSSAWELYEKPQAKENPTSANP